MSATEDLPSRGDGASTPLPGLGFTSASEDQGAAFQDHVLLVLSGLSATVSPSASLSQPLLSAPVPVVPAFKGPGASTKTEAILGELQLLALRLHDSEQRERVAQAQLAAALITLPNGSVPAQGLLAPRGGQGVGSTPALSVSDRLRASPTYPLQPPPFSPSGSSILTSGNINMYESGLGPTEELRLLRAQVQDIARVCKVRRTACSSFG